jgi:hypothetical protein
MTAATAGAGMPPSLGAAAPASSAAKGAGQGASSSPRQSGRARQLLLLTAGQCGDAARIGPVPDAISLPRSA